MKEYTKVMALTLNSGDVIVHAGMELVIDRISSVFSASAKDMHVFFKCGRVKSFSSGEMVTKVVEITAPETEEVCAKDLRKGDLVRIGKVDKVVTNFYHYSPRHDVKLSFDDEPTSKHIPSQIFNKLTGAFVEGNKVIESIAASKELTEKLQQLHQVLCRNLDEIPCGDITISKAVLLEVLNKQVKALTNKLYNLSK